VTRRVRASTYLHGTAPDEQRRLSTMNRLLNDSSLREIAVQPGERVVDFGCGLAQLTRDMARAAGRPALGIERSEAQIAEARRQAREAGEEALVELRPGDVLAPPLQNDEWGSFDLAHARFVLEHVPTPSAVVRAMVRAVRPGGRIVLEDDDHWVMRFWPEPVECVTLWRAYVETFTRIGNDPQVGRKLVSLLHEAGVRPRRNTWIFFGGCAGEEHFPLLVENMAVLFAGARDAMLAGGMLDAESFAAAIVAFRDWGRRPDAALWFARCWAEGVRTE
jgi:SAM-dependent methyltransferase